MAQQVADNFGIGKRAVNMRRQSAAAVIGEEIDFDLDTPEELERKAAELEREADKRQHVEPKVEPRKRIRLVIKRPTSPAKPEAAEAGSKFEEVWESFNTLSRVDQLRLIHAACLHVGLDPLKMASPTVFGLAEEEPELDENAPAAVAPATDVAAAAAAEPGEDGADLGAKDLQIADDDGSEDADDDASEAADQENLGAEDLEDAGDAVPEAADQEPASPNLHAEHLKDAGVGSSEATDQEPGGATKCAYCTMEFYSSDERVMIHGRLYHADLCAKFAKPIAIAA
jgi:hypothetical protein